MSSKPSTMQIEALASYLPEHVVTNADLKAENPRWDMPRIEAKSGVLRRHIARDHETALDLGVRACKQLLTANEGLRAQVDGVIFCTQSEDYIMPPNACVLHKHLGLSEDVFAFDFNLACSGYIYGLAMAEGLLAAGRAANILFVTADTYSKYIHKQDRSVRVLFGDGAAVSWLTRSSSDAGVIDILCSTAGAHYDKFMIPAGGCRTPHSAATCEAIDDESGNVRTLENIHMNGMGILAFVSAKVPTQVRAILERNQLTVDDIDCFIFHQASKMALDTLTARLKIAPHKVYRNLQRVGNTVSASIPIALENAMTDGSVKTGDTVLMCGFGVGLSWGSALLKV